jgi:endonuclease/exonuclease/phosphatase family metal-dependent hydrolase
MLYNYSNIRHEWHKQADIANNYKVGVIKTIAHKVALILLILLAGCSEVVKTTNAKGAELNRGIGPVELQVMTYNVHHCNPPSKEKAGIIELSSIAKVIEGASPDIVFLQEIDDHNSRSGKDINQAEALAKLLGMNYYYGKAIDFAGGGYGVAILSRFSLSGSQVYFLPKSEHLKSEQRVLLTAIATLENKQKLRIACTHLDVVSSENRVMQSNRIIDILKKDTMPVILGGDLNDTINSQTIINLSNAFKLDCKSCLPTVPADAPKDGIDYIFTDWKYKWQILTYYVGEDHYASDHRPVISKLSLR